MPRSTRVADAAWGMAVLLVVVGLGAYVGVRARALSFTHDESLTYTSYVHDSFSSILLSRGTDANNHPLNTLAMKLAADMFGTSELALRWSSVIAFVIYVFALVVLLRHVERRSIRVLGLALAVANPFVLDFFSLARGYALALALVVASAMATFDFVERPRARTALAAAMCAALAVLANYATLDYYLAVLVVIVLALIVPARTSETRLGLGRLAAVLLPPTLGVAFLAVIPLLRLRSEGELYFGGSDGFWQDTVRTLVSSTLYGHRWDALEITFMALVAMLVAGGGVAMAVAIRRRSFPLDTAAFMLLAVAALASIVQHWVFGSPFLIGRTALFLVPLFAIWLSFAADALARSPRFTSGVRAAAVAIVVAVCINVASAANVSYVLDWRYDATTEEAITELAGMRGDPRSLDLGVSFLFQPTTNFYRETRFKSLRECFSDCLDARSHYYYVIGPDVATVRERGARVIRIYALTGGVLARDTEAG